MNRGTIARNLPEQSLEGGARQGLGGAALGALLAGSLVVCFYAILPMRAALALVAVFAWSALPGVIIARRLYGSQHGTWTAALLVGPAWGFCASSVVLLGLWVAGVRGGTWLALAPVGALMLALPAGWLTGSLTLPRFDRRDIAWVLFVLLLVPAVNGRPYARVGEMRPEGKAYRAYFIADFEWAMAVAAEVSKGDVLPRNPFLATDTLHYYWLADLLSAVEHRLTQRTLTVDQVLLVNALLMDLAFVAFFYFFIRHFVTSPSAAAAACVAVVLFSSFEGAQQLLLFWRRKVPLDGLLSGFRNLNIDAISNWTYQSFKVDGLQRLLLYQPHHATAWAVSLSGLVVLLESRDNGRPGVNWLAGILLGLGLLLSSFIALMVGSVVAIYQLVTLAFRRRWQSLMLAGIAGGIPAALAVAATLLLRYVDRSGVQLIYVGQLNPLARTNALFGIWLSFGPALIAAAVGAALGLRRRATALGPLGLMIAVSFFFYFFVDVIDHQHAYVAFRAGHLLFMAFAPLVGFAWQELAAASGSVRITAAGGAVLLALLAAPMTIVDLYNSQDTDNRAQGPGFKWTEIVTTGELEALDWIKKNTPPSALVQVDPTRESGTWAYMPAFGERRTVAAMPISMIPLQKYVDASAKVQAFFTQSEASNAYALACSLKLQYVYLGPAEQKKYPRLLTTLDGAPHWFRPVFRNEAVAIYRVT
ncbi:MAG: hypothetical protein DMF89_04135 [Acidobacteria bacterium]|nr:MAG: hypothetical protein DMF89_04135 [Acidobacteriota bacterium]